MDWLSHFGFHTVPFTPEIGVPHSCALKGDGTLWCWGNNDYFQLGTGQTHEQCVAWGDTFDCSRTPVQVTGLSDVVDVSLGQFHTCALLSDGTVRCWGGNWGRQLGAVSQPDELCVSGSDSLECSRNPVQPEGLNNVAALGQGGDLHQCAIKSDGTAWCWGFDEFGQVGDGADVQTCHNFQFGDYRCQPTPVQITTLSSVLVIDGGQSYSCGFTADQRPWCWGDGSWGKLGLGASGGERNAPAAVVDLAAVVDIEAGNSHTCAVATDRTGWCWGRNSSGELGNETVTELHRPSPVPVLQ